MSRVEIVINPNASGFLGRPGLIGDVHRIARGQARVWTTSQLDALAGAAEQILDGAPDLVVLIGGDGSFMAGVTALVDAYGERPLPMVALVNGGTTGTVSKNFGMRESVLKALRRALSAAPLETRERPTLRVREHSGETRIGFTVGTGLVAKFFKRYYEEGAGGIPTAARIVSRIFLGSFRGDGYAKSVLDPLPCRIRVGDRDLPYDAFSLVLASVLRDVGMHMLVNYRAAEDPKRPHLVASALPAKKLGPQCPRVLTGRPLRGPENYDALVEEFEIRFPDGAGPYVLDGDIFETPSLNVTTGPTIQIVM